MGYLSVKTMVDHLQKRSVPATVDTGVLLVTADNLNQPDVIKILSGS